MDLESKLSEIIQLLLTTYQNKKTSLQLHNDLFTRINTFVYFSQDPNLLQLPDVTKNLLTSTLEDLKETLQDVNSGEDGLLSKAMQLFQTTPLKKLEGMVSRLLKLSDQIIQALTVQKYIDHKINQKRRLTSLPPDNEVEEIEASSLVAKKVKGVGNVIPIQNKMAMDTKFRIRVICHPRLNDRFPTNERNFASQWDNELEENALLIKRDDYLTLPKDLVVKISKEHAKIRGWKSKEKTPENNEEQKGEEMLEEVNYQIIDSSINGTYFLGNRIDGMSKQKPMKLKGGSPFPLRNGDCVGFLMDKESKTFDMLVGFEFILGDDKEENVGK